MKKKNVVLFNVGHRDLEFKETIEVNGKTVTQYLPKDKGENFREYSQFVLDHYDEYASVIKFPLIETTLLYLEKVDEKKLNTIYLCASDQDPVSPHYKTDTIYVAYIFKQYINGLRREEKWKKILEEVETPKVVKVSSNPADLDLMNQFYDDFFTSLSRRGHVHKIYISTTGGAPAMNNMAWFNGIKYFQDDAECVYLTNQHQSPRMLNIGKKLVQETYIRTVKENIHVYEYFAARRFLESVSCKFSNKSVLQTVIKLLEYGHHRLLFQFEEAVESIRVVEHEEAAVALGDRIYLLKDEIFHLTEDTYANNEAIKDYMYELYWNAYILYHKGQYIDVCGRVFRFQEQALNYLITIIFGVPVKDRKFIDESWLQEQSGLIEHMKTRQIRDVARTDLNRKVMHAAADYYISQGEGQYRKTLDTISSLDELADIRNQSPMAHGFKGVSEKKIFETVQTRWNLQDQEEFKPKLFQKMREIHASLFGEEQRLEINAYEHINSVILQLLEKLT